MVLNAQEGAMLRQWLAFWKSRGVQYLPRLSSEEMAILTATGTVQTANRGGAPTLQGSLPAASTPQIPAVGLGNSTNPGSNPSPVNAVPPAGSLNPLEVGQAPVAAGNVQQDASGRLDPNTGRPATEWLTPCLALPERQGAMEVLRQTVSACERCPELVRNRRQTVFGVGNVQTSIVFMGEAPGADEDRVGEPFVGRAGELLNKIIAASQLKREEIYILNTLKCRPPNNRTPVEVEVEACRPFFERQLEVLQPKYIVCWGVVAVRALLGGTASIGQLRGRWHSYKAAKVLVTYHPAYLLRNEDAKRFTWEDIQMLMRDLGIQIPGKK